MFHAWMIFVAAPEPFISCLMPLYGSKQDPPMATNTMAARKDGVLAECVATAPAPPSISQDDAHALNMAYRKIDRRILLWYCFVCLIFRIGSHNITNAAIMNLEDGTDIQHQLGDLTSEQWALILSIYHYPHMIFDPVSTLLLKRFTPRKWMSRIMITWGIISMCQAATRNFGGLLTCRFLLGLSEAGFAPGVLLHLSFWYPAERLTFRIALLLAFSMLSGTASGLLAYAISFLNGKANFAGWQWLFLLEGMPAVLGGCVTLWFLPNYPDEACFLDEAERSSILANIPKTQPSSQDKTCDWSEVKSLFADPLTYTFLSIWICHGIAAGGIGTVLPTVIYSLGLSGTTIAQLMTMPPSVFGAASLLLIAWLVRRKMINSWATASCLGVFAGVCYTVITVVEDPVVRYVFITLAVTSSVSVYPILWPERIRASRGTTSAGLAIGLTAASSQLSGIVGPQVYQKKFGPTYSTSFEVSIGFFVVAIISIVVTWTLVKKRDSKTQEGMAMHERKSGAASEIA